MEKPLLRGETSGEAVSGRRRDRAFKRRSDAIAFGSPYQKAAALVDLAEDGVGIPEKILEQSSFQNAARLYFMFIRFDIIWTLSYFALLALNFFEKPLWCVNNPSDPCGNREYYYLGQLPYFTALESLIYEGVTLLVLVVHTLFPLSYEGSHLYWKNPLNILKVIGLVVLVADLVVYGVYVSPLAFDSLPFRIAPYVRVIFFILNIRELRSSIVILAGMLGTYLNILALWLLFLLFSSWVAYVIFEDTQQGNLVLTSYGTTLYHMFVLFTTSNNPDVWIPAYKQARWYSLFFILYVLLGVYFVTNLILAVVYDSFKSEPPVAVDWTPTIQFYVKNQYHTNLCWAFASCSAVESAYALYLPGELRRLFNQFHPYNLRYIRLSEQYLVNCMHPLRVEDIDRDGSRLFKHNPIHALSWIRWDGVRFYFDCPMLYLKKSPTSIAVDEARRIPEAKVRIADVIYIDHPELYNFAPPGLYHFVTRFDDPYLFHLKKAIAIQPVVGVVPIFHDFSYAPVSYLLSIYNPLLPALH